LKQDYSSNSPNGYTYSSKVQVYGKDNPGGTPDSVDLGGWGNNDSSHFEAGEWTVEVWYNGFCLCFETVRIN
jgi:hypothetical protein